MLSALVAVTSSATSKCAHMIDTYESDTCFTMVLCIRSSRILRTSSSHSTYRPLDQHNTASMVLLNELASSENGTEWLMYLCKQCIDALTVIDDKLSSVQTVPKLALSVLPLHMIRPSAVKLVVFCKEPYTSEFMATGIPVETANGIETPSATYFTGVISSYWGGVKDISSAMRCYYASGILVLNASPTVQVVQDKRYSLAASHFSLWAKFMRPLVRQLLATGVPIVALGSEPKQLVRNVESRGLVYQCPFPSDSTTAKDFYECLGATIDEYVYDRSRALPNTMARNTATHAAQDNIDYTDTGYRHSGQDSI